MSEPRLEAVALADGREALRLSGRWTLAELGPRAREIGGALLLSRNRAALWDLGEISALDTTGAMMLWRAWGRALPLQLEISTERRAMFERIAALDVVEHAITPRPMPGSAIVRLGQRTLLLAAQLCDLVSLIGQMALDLVHLFRHPTDAPWREISATLYKSGARAMPICALLGFLIGVVLSYLSALQLRNFGAETFIVNILGLGIVRELGPVLVAVLVAGRSGSAMTAQLGVMRVTEEIDALASMGVSRTLRLVLPKVLALSLATPLLVLCTTAAALLGGMVAANWQLDLSYGFFLETLPRVVRLSNLFIGLSKGVAFGFVIAVLACHFGLRVKPNTESLSANTTTSVVVAITVVILIDAVFALVMRGVGMPG